MAATRERSPSASVRRRCRSGAKSRCETSIRTQRSLRLLGKGTDSTGSSGASMDLSARIEGVAVDSSNLVGKSEVTMSGKAAAFGGRMMNSVAEQILKQFADNFAVQVAALAAQRNAAAAPASTAASAGRKRRHRPPNDPPQTASFSCTPPRELNGLALIWAVVEGLAARPVWQENLRERHAATNERGRHPAASVAGVRATSPSALLRPRCC